MRPSDIGASSSGGTRGIDPMENYSPEDYDRLMKSYEGKTQKFRDGGSLERPNRNKKVDRSLLDQGAITPIRMLTAAMMNRRDRKEDRKYQESLKDMGMFEDGGGRANVSSSKDKMYMAPPKDMREKFRDKREKFRDGGSVRGHKSSQMSGTGFSGTF
jgi:hypothetical protein